MPNDDTAAIASPYGKAHVRGVIGHYLRARLLAGLAGILFTILLARHMAVPDYARFATIAGLAATVGMLSSLGLEKAVTCYLPQGRIRHTSAVLAQFIWRVLGLRVAVLVAATSVLAGAWSSWTGPSSLAGETILPAAIWIVATNGFQFVALILQCLVQQKSLSLVLLVQWGGRLALLAGLLASATALPLHSALLVMVIPELSGTAILLIALRRHLQHLAATDTAPALPRVTWPVWRDVRKLMRHNYGYAWLVAVPQANAMILLAALFLSVPQVAAYGFFASIVERLRTYLPLQFMLNLAEPVLVAGYVRDRNFDTLYRRSSLLYKMNSLLLMALIAWGCAIAPALTRLLAGEKYAACAMLFPLLLGQIALGSFNTILQVVVNSVGRSDLLTRSGSVALMAMGLCFLAVMLAGTKPLLLLATPLVFEVANMAMTIFLLRRAGFPGRWHGPFHAKVVFAGIVAALAACQVIAGISHALIQVLAAGIVATAAFAAVCAMLRIAERDDVVELKALLQRRPGEGP
jgi:pyruvyl transferase EpsO